LKLCFSDAILKLEEALFLEPYHHKALWYLGHAFGMVSKHSDESEMDYYAKKAARCYQRAFELVQFSTNESIIEVWQVFNLLTCKNYV
jgi:hypothetical protein